MYSGSRFKSGNVEYVCNAMICVMPPLILSGQANDVSLRIQRKLAAIIGMAYTCNGKQGIHIRGLISAI
jgi:hypothetical protein